MKIVLERKVSSLIIRQALDLVFAGLGSSDR